MRKIVNPFIVTGKIDPAYFCDREEESARLIRSLDNGNNLVIISPRMEKNVLHFFHRHLTYFQSEGVYLYAGERDL